MVFFCHSSLVQFSHEGSHFLLKGRQIGFKDSPNDVIGNRSAAMDETIGEGNYPACVTYPGRETWVEAEGLCKGLSNDLKLSNQANVLIPYNPFSKKIKEMLQIILDNFSLKQNNTPKNLFIVSEAHSIKHFSSPWRGSSIFKPE